MSDQWRPASTNAHQDHVVAHVLGTSVLGYFISDEAAHLVLDIGFIWTIYLDGEMGMLTEALVISELSLSDPEKESLLQEIGALHQERGGAAEAPERIKRAPDGCVIEDVEFYASEDGRRVLVRGAEASLFVETSLSTRSLRIHVV